MTENEKGLTKKQKIMIVMVAILAVVGISGTVYASQTQKKLSEAQSIVNKEQGSLKELTLELQKLLDTKDNEYLAENVTTEKIAALQKKFKQTTENVQSLSVDTKKLKATAFTNEKKGSQNLMEIIEKKFSTQEAVNKLYQSKDKVVALNGSKVTTDLEIADDLKNESIQLIKEDYLQDTTESSFNKTILELTTNAEKQVKQIATAKTAVAKLYKDNTVISTDSKLYTNAKSETDKIKNSKAKKSLSDQLTKVKSDIDKKSKETEVTQEVVTQRNSANQQIDTAKEQKMKDPVNEENMEANNPNDNNYSGNYASADNGISQQPQVSPPATESEYTGEQGATDNGAPSFETGTAETSGNNSTADQSAPAQGASFASREEAVAWGMANTAGGNGYYIITFEGRYYVYPN